MRTMTKCVMAAGWLFVGSYGCRQVIGWEEATYWGDGGSGGSSSSSSSSAGGMAGAAGNGGMGGMAGNGGMAGAGGMGGSDAGTPECVTAMDCPKLTNATPTCTNGACGFTCNIGFGDCTAAPGCETALLNNRNHCGTCGNACAAYCTVTTCNDPVSIAGGYHHHCAVMKNGDVYCWGRNEKGELGDGTLASKSVPTKVKLTSPAVQVDGGASANMNNYTPKTCAAMVNGELWCWGEGNGNPAKVAGLSNVKQVSVGDAHTCAVTTTGTVYCWGGNTYGQIGDGGKGYAAIPVLVIANTSIVSAGAKHTCGVMNTGALQCWGHNGDGQLGIGSYIEALSPTAVTGIVDATGVQCANGHTCANSKSAKAYCWGANQVGQLGTGNINQSNVPVTVNLQASEAIDVGYNFSGAIHLGNISMWGFNSSGQLGNGTTNILYAPMMIALTDVQSVSLASTSACALLKNGELRCWGANIYGQLGNGGNQQKLSPTPILWP